MNEIEKSRITEINTLHSEIGGHLKMTLDKAIRIGELLTEQKAGLQHGKWIPWIEENLPFSERSVRDYMRFYDRREELKTARIADLTEARELLIEKIASSEEPAFLRELKRVEKLNVESDKKVEKLERLAEEIKSILKRSWDAEISAELVVLFLLITETISFPIYRTAKALLDCGLSTGDNELVNEALRNLKHYAVLKSDFGGGDFKKGTAYKRLCMKYEVSL